MNRTPSYAALLKKVTTLEKELLERKHSEERIQHLNAVLKSIRDVNRLMTKEKNEERLIKGICKSLVKNRGYYNAWIAFTDRSGTMISIVETGLGESITAVEKKIRHGELIYCFDKVLKQSGIVTINDPIAVCRDCPLVERYAGRGAIAIRLEHKNQVFGMLVVSVPVIFCSDTEEHHLFRIVAGDIAFALHGMEAETERRKAESALRHARDDLERRVKERTHDLEILSSKILNAQEAERKRIAGDLHDGIGQSLSAIKFMVETLIEQMKDNCAQQEKNSLKSLVPMLQKASEEVRTIVMNLRPSILDDLGIITTIGWFCRQFRSVYSGIQVEECIEIREKDIPESLKIIIFRVLQEAMNNVAKHSQGAIVCLQIKKTDEFILSVKDNGIGFDAVQQVSMPSSQRGFGITGMKERTELSGGTFKIESAKGKGTLVQASWQYSKMKSIL